MSLPSSAFAPLSGVDWPMATLVAPTPGACACAVRLALSASTAAVARVRIPFMRALLSGGDSKAAHARLRRNDPGRAEEEGRGSRAQICGRGQDRRRGLRLDGQYVH